MLKFPVPTAPWKEIWIDYTDIGTAHRTANGYGYLLVVVDRYTKWVEAIPTKSENSEKVTEWLIKEHIPRYSVPTLICSDNASHFKNEHLQTVESFYGIKHRFGSVYRPQLQGIVERAKSDYSRENWQKQCMTQD